MNKHCKNTIVYYVNSFNKFLNHITSEYTHEDYNLSLYNKYFILHNNNKWYCLIIPFKNNVYLCFFDNKGSVFYIETHLITCDEIFLEGYIYGTDTCKTFQVTDILAINSVIINKTYNDRLILLENIMKNIQYKLQDLNAYMSFQMHTRIYILNNENKQFIGLTDEHVEIIDGYKKSIENNQKEQNYKVMKIITFIKIPDVYHVFNNDTNEKEGILYVKTIEDSKKLAKMFQSEQTIVLPCIFNNKFKKWQANTI